MRKIVWAPLLVAVSIALGIWIGERLNHNRTVSTHGEEKLMNILRLINRDYVDEVDIDTLVEKALPSILQQLDPHSTYIPPSDYALEKSQLDGKFSGVGISFNIINDTLMVVESISGGPAEKAGILPGDRIIMVDDLDIATTPITESQVFSLLRGEKDTHVKLTVKRRTSKEPLVFDIKRDDIKTNSVDAAYMLNDSVGYIRVNKFANNTSLEFRTALVKLSLQGASGFVIDLRDNGGGYMGEALIMANELMPGGRLIVSTKGRNPREDDIIYSDGTGLFQNSDVVVIVNEFSASASEIFAGAIQDNDRGWVIGRRSFGKGLVQKPITLPDSSEVRLTTQRYYTPSGRCIQKDYTNLAEYSADIMNRFNHGELLSADSVKLNLDDKYYTVGGREVYGGGGIMPDYFVPEDTTYITSYYRNAVNKGLISKFAFEYYDLNREQLSKAQNVDKLLEMMPSDSELLNSFVKYAKDNGLAPRWYYINNSAPLIVNQIKALVARNLLGMDAFYMIFNKNDKTILEAIRHIDIPIPRE